MHLIKYGWYKTMGIFLVSACETLFYGAQALPDPSLD